MRSRSYLVIFSFCCKMEIKDVLDSLWFVFWSIYLGFKGSFLQNWRIFLQHVSVLPRSLGCCSSGMLGRAWNSPRANRDKPPVARNACRRVRAPWRFSSGLDSRRTSDDGDYTAVWWRWVFLQSAAAPADSSMTALWRFGWGAGAQHGHRGLHLRDAARWCALGIHPTGGRGGHLQTFPCLPGKIRPSDHVLDVTFIETRVFIWGKTGSFYILVFRNLK